MVKQLKPVPKVANEAAERGFWQTHDSTEYLHWSKARKTPPLVGASALHPGLARRHRFAARTLYLTDRPSWVQQSERGWRSTGHADPNQESRRRHHECHSSS